MRLVAVVDSLGLGGAERLLVTLARHAPSADLQLEVLALRDVGATVVTEGLAAEGVDVRYVPTRCRHHLADPRRLVRLARELRRAGPDVVQTHLGTANVLGVAAARLSGVPVVATLHNVRLEAEGLRQRTEDAALRRADAIVAVGEEVARTHGAALAPRPITVVPNPVDPAVLAPRDGGAAAIRGELLGSGPGPLVLAVGRLEPQKAHSVLLDAVSRLVRRHPGLVLAVAGQGRLAADLCDQADALGLGGHVRLLGARRDVADLLAGADLFVNASHYEGLPLVVLEAMAAGTPVVATDAGDVRAVVDGAGLVVPPGDPSALATGMGELLGDDRSARLYAERGRQIVRERYHPTGWVERLRAVYDVAGGLVPAAAS